MSLFNRNRFLVVAPADPTAGQAPLAASEPPTILGRSGVRNAVVVSALDAVRWLPHDTELLGVAGRPSEVVLPK